MFAKVAVLFLLLFPTISYSKERPETKQVLTIVADIWCPYNCNQGDKNLGFMVDIAKKSFAKHNIEVRYLPTTSWTDAIDGARKGLYDGVVGASSMDVPDFVFPKIAQGRMQNVFYTKKDSKWEFYSINSLKSIKLGVIADYSYGDDLNLYIEQNKNNKDILDINTRKDALQTDIRHLVGNSLDVMIEARYVVDYFLYKNKKFRGKIREAGHLKENSQNDLFIAFSPKLKHAMRYSQILSEETKKMRDSGELQKIMEVYGLRDWTFVNPIY